jgi:monoamine oxidase
VRDYLAYDDAAGEANWRVREGLGTVIASALPETVAVRLSTPVTLIDHGGKRLRLVTPRGDILTDRAIVAVPTTVLANGLLGFTPALPAKREAAAALPLGLADKLFLGVGNPDDFPRDTHLLGNPHRVETGSYQLQPMGFPVVEAFYGGRAARALERAGAEGMAAFALDELANLLGSDVRKHLRPLAHSAWGKTRWIEGGYSHALPGRADARAVLAEPIENRIFFAGEACSASDFSTAHGALDTGMAAAALAALGG